MNNPKVSIVIPISDMKNGDYFLKRCLETVNGQNYKNFEILTPKEGKVAYNLNCGIKQATGDIIKILCMDDYFGSPDSLGEIVYNWTKKWLVSACVHHSSAGITDSHMPGWNDEIHRGYNTIGGLSVISIQNDKDDPLLFTEGLDWVVDVDFLKRAFLRYGLPKFLMSNNVVIGVGDHQLTRTLTEEQKQKEQFMMAEKYGY